MADKLAGLVVQLEAQTAKFEQGMKRAERKLAKFEKTQNKTLKKVDLGFAKVARTIKGGFVSALAAAGVGLGVGFVKSVTDVAARLDDFAIRIGASATQLQTWQLAAATAGIQSREFNMALQRVTRRAAEAAEGMGEAKDALKTLGIDARQFGRLNLDDQMLDLAKAFEGVDNEAQQLRLAFKLFDSEGTSFLQLLKEGESGLEKLRDSMRGSVWDDETRAKLKKANEALTVMGEKFTIMAGEVASFLLTAGSNFLDWLDGVGTSGNEAAEAIERVGRHGRNARNNLAAPAPAVRVTGTRASRRGKSGRIGAHDNAATIARQFEGGRFDPNVRRTSLGSFDATPERFAPNLHMNKDGTPNFAEGTTTRENVAQMNALVFGAADQQKAKYEETWKRIGQAGEDTMTTVTDVMMDNWAEGLKRSEEQSKAFGDLFVDNMVSAQESGFKAVLDGWVRTLAQMALKAQAMNLFKYLFPEGTDSQGGGIAGLAGKIFGFDSGGVVPGPRGAAQLAMVHGGETILPTHKGGTMGGININQTLNVSGASRSEFIAAANALKEQTLNEVFDKMRRGR